MPLANDRKTDERAGKQTGHPVAAATLIYKGALVALDSSGNLVPASAVPTLRVVGMAEDHVDNSDGSAGDLTCVVRAGIFEYANSSAGDAIVDDNIGQVVYAADDFTVALTAGAAGTRPIAGVVRDVDSAGVWVEVGAAIVAAAQHVEGIQRDMAADAAVAITAQDRIINLNSTTGSKAITTASSRPGQLVELLLDTVSGGAYTITADPGGALTLDAENDRALLMRDGTNSAWLLVASTIA